MDPLTLAGHEQKIRQFESTLKDDDKSAYETEKRTRTVLRGKVTRGLNNLQTEIDDDDRDMNKLKSYMDYLVEAAGKLESTQQEIEELTTDDEALEAENYIHFHRYAKRVMDLKAATTSIIADAKVTEWFCNIAKSASTQVRRVQLQRVENIP